MDNTQMSSHNLHLIKFSYIIQLISMKSHRPLKLVIANISLKRPLAGLFLNALNGIGIQRAIDQAKQPGQGKIIELRQNLLKGKDTDFTKLTVGSILFIGDSYKLTVQKIISQTFLEVKEVLNFPDQQKFYEYSYLLKVDSSNFYRQLEKAFKNEEIVCIFPEGVSTNGPKLQKLKPGICKGAFQAMRNGCSSIKFVPCGANYENQSVFRSSMVLEIGKPFQIPKNLRQRYQFDEKGAVEEFLVQMQGNLRPLITEAKSLKEKEVATFCQRLITEGSQTQTEYKQQLRINRMFAKKFSQDEQCFQDIQKDVAQLQFHYSLQLATKYSKVLDSPFVNSLIQILTLIFLAIFMFPGATLFFPVYKIVEYYVQKERMKRFNAQMGQGAKKYHRIHVAASEYIANFFYVLTCLFVLLLSLAFISKLNISYFLRVLSSITLFFGFLLYLRLFVNCYDRLKISWLRMRNLYFSMFKTQKYAQMRQKVTELYAKIMSLKESLEKNGKFEGSQTHEEVLQAK